MLIEPFQEHALIVDIETTTKNKHNSFGGSPFDPNNKVVVVGSKRHSKGTLKDNSAVIWWDGGIYPELEQYDVAVGHNIKFDMLYLLRDNYIAITTLMENGCIFWDTMLVEYLLSGQETKMVPLEKLSKKYGLDIEKGNVLQEYWDKGLDVDDIPVAELDEYVVTDVNMTYRIYHYQLIRMSNHSEEFQWLVYHQLQALHATIMMEYNGMNFDLEIAETEALGLAEALAAAEAALVLLMEHKGIVNASPASNHHVSCYLFGGTHKYKTRANVLDSYGNVVLYKTGPRAGSVKTRLVTTDTEVEGITSPKPEWETKFEGVYKVGDDILSKLPTLAGVPEIKEYRRLHKELGTYYLPFIEMVFPDGCIHGSLHHSSTNTGRLSSTNPNLQNFTK